MNDTFTRDDFATLVAHQDFPAISIYLPTHPVSTYIQEEIVQLKNMVREAEEQLDGTELRAPEIREMTAPAHALIDDADFWINGSMGLALFMAPGFFKSFRLPIEFEPLMEVGATFHIKPLLPLMTNDGLFYLLAVSQNDVRVLRGSRYTVEALEVENIPHSLAEALRYDDPDNEQQYHMATATPGVQRGNVLLGTNQGGDADYRKTNLLRYFQQIDRGMHELLHEAQVPLVFAGVDYLLPIYREANSYHHLVDKGVTGSPDRLSAKELHAQAWALVEPVFAEKQKAAIEQYFNLSNTDLISHKLEELLPAAFYGRVDTAFVPKGANAWGTFDTETGKVQMADENGPEHQDLYDLLAIYTLQRSGQVFVLDAVDLPEGGPVAGIYRYAV